MTVKTALDFSGDGTNPYSFSNSNEWWEFLTDWNTRFINYYGNGQKGQRRGQALMNALSDVRYDLFELPLYQSWDPYDDDNNIPEFHIRIYHAWKESRNAES